MVVDLSTQYHAEQLLGVLQELPSSYKVIEMRFHQDDEEDLQSRCVNNDLSFEDWKDYLVPLDAISLKPVLLFLFGSHRKIEVSFFSVGCEMVSWVWSAFKDVSACLYLEDSEIYVRCLKEISEYNTIRGQPAFVRVLLLTLVADDGKEHEGPYPDWLKNAIESGHVVESPVYTRNDMILLARERDAKRKREEEDDDLVTPDQKRKKE